MSLVDYRGFRLIAMSILPIRGSESIIYGSDNYGETMYNSNRKMEGKLKSAAKMLNIKQHKCGVNVHASATLCSPADLEGHIGTDGRFYLLDFSRVLPPETPVRVNYLFFHSYLHEKFSYTLFRESRMLTCIDYCDQSM